MALRINTNVAALYAHKNLSSTDCKLSNSLSKLSSGLRINKAADDASGMVIADSLKAQSLGLGQAIKNASDGINIVQTADAALAESVNIINVIKTKSIQAAQDGQTTESRKAIQSDISRLMEELDMIANTTSFNNQKLLSGNFTNKKFQVGAYSNEVVNISIAPSQSNKIGHTMTSKLSIDGDKPGIVDISLYSNIQNKNYDVETIDVAFDNDRDHGMGAVANSINKLSDLLGISAKAFVGSTTETAVLEGKTDSTFAINGVLIGEIAVLSNDSNGALTNSINNKTQQHGVVASVDVKGLLTLTSTDGRTIDVMSKAGTSKVFDDTNMSTVGYIQLNQTGANEIIINDTAGGNVVSLEDGKFEISSSEPTIAKSTVAKGSIITTNSVLGAGWTTNQVIYGDKFNQDITTTEESFLTKGSGLNSGSVVAAKGLIGATMTTGAASTALVGEGMLLTGSTITSGSTLGVGSVINSNTDIVGEETVIEATTVPTTSDSTIKDGSVLTAGTVLAANTECSNMTSISIAATGVTTGESTIRPNSVFGTGTILSNGTEIYDKAILQQTGQTIGENYITSGSILAKGSILGAGTEFNDIKPKVQLTEKTMSNSTIDSGSTLTTGSVIGAGTILTSGLLTNVELGIYATSKNPPLIAGDTLPESFTFTTPTTFGVGQNCVLAADSILGNGTELGSGSIIMIDLTLSADLALSANTAMQPKTNSSFATDTILNNGSQAAIIKTDVTLKAPMVVSNGGGMTVKTGSSFGKNTTFATSNLPFSISIATKITLVASSTLSGSDITAGMGSLFGNNTTLKAGSKISTDVTLNVASTLSGSMTNIINDMTLGSDTVFNTGSKIQDGSSLNATFEITGNPALTSDMTFGENSIFKNETYTKFNLGSKIGGDAYLASELSVIADITIGTGSNLQKGTTLTNGSTLGSDTVIANDETVAAGTQMELAKGTNLKTGSIITAGTYLTNDLITTEGIFKAGNELLKDITTKGDNILTYPMTVSAGSVIKAKSTLGMNIADANAAKTQVADPENNRLSDIDVLTQQTAQIAIAVAASALQDIDKVRADLGSIQNQLTATIGNITTTKVNIMASESTIRDVDFANESSNFTKLQILAQAGTFALGQANASSQHVMSLLK